MKRIKLTTVLALIFAPTFLFSTDFIRGDYMETNRHSVHSSGLLTYGAHTNTFHLRYFYLRYNLQFTNVQFFATVSGYKDTHQPETDYPNILNNIQLYDYGVAFRFLDLVNLSLRGAAVYSMDTETYLLMPHYRSTNNAGEFDSPAQYFETFLNAAGIRVGLSKGGFMFGYSQGDWRHCIPMAAMVGYKFSMFEATAVAQIHNADPLVYDINNYRVRWQANFKADVPVGDLSFKGIVEFHMNEAGNFAFRCEEAVVYEPWDATFAMRQIVWNDLPALFEFSLTKRFYDIASFGVFAATDGRIYIGTSVDF